MFNYVPAFDCLGLFALGSRLCKSPTLLNLSSFAKEAITVFLSDGWKGTGNKRAAPPVCFLSASGFCIFRWSFCSIERLPLSVIRCASVYFSCFFLMKFFHFKYRINGCNIESRCIVKKYHKAVGSSFKRSKKTASFPGVGDLIKAPRLAWFNSIKALNLDWKESLSCFVYLKPNHKFC